MMITYALLSPTFGMHQYTADLANRMAAAGHEVTLVTTTGYPADRYAPGVDVRTPLSSTGTGFAPEALRLRTLRRVYTAILTPTPPIPSAPLPLRSSAPRPPIAPAPLPPRTSAPPHPCPPAPPPAVVHFPAVHLWNVPLVWALRRRGVPVVHTLHDLDPHVGRRFGSLIRLWNRLIIGSGCHLLVHGQRYRARLVDSGVAPKRVTVTPLLHLFLRHMDPEELEATARDVSYEPWALFFGRIKPYKGVDHLIEACRILGEDPSSPRTPAPPHPRPPAPPPPGTPAPRVVIAGPGDLATVHRGPLPPNVELRNHLVGDEEALELFRRCGVLVLPYVDATQSALIAAAYHFRKPVIVTRAGALPEYVEPGHTGWIVPPADPAALADRLAHALSDPARLREMGPAARAWYDHQRCQERRTMETLYEDLRQGPR